MHPDTMELMIPLWLGSRVDFEKFYKMMPFEAKARAHGVGDRSEWPAFCRELKHFQRYVAGFFMHNFDEWNRHRICLAMGRKYSLS